MEYWYGNWNTHFFGDVKEYDWYPASAGDFTELRFGADLSATKMINNLYGFQITVNRGGFAGLRKKEENVLVVTQETIH